LVAKIIDGQFIASKLRQDIKDQVSTLGEYKPSLAIILIGEHLPSQIYVRNKQKACEEVGIKFSLYHFPGNILQEVVVKKIEQLNNDPDTHGILVQFPLPTYFNQFDIINAISPEKDVDGFHILNVGKLTLGIDSFIPCTALGILNLIYSIEKNLPGKKALIIGRSNVVGRPIGQLLLRENCTVTYAHSKTINLESECLQNEIIVSAIGHASFIKAAWLHSEQIIIDVGISRTEVDGITAIKGDVEFEAAKNIVKAITPVPGGVGPMTIAYLLQNTLKAFENNHIRKI
jgi:methylenetetrahydrofolate dehydrogenase (NADP+)/methenyltetrahydrofolate cyclohydrolase